MGEPESLLRQPVSKKKILAFLLLDVLLAMLLVVVEKVLAANCNLVIAREQVLRMFTSHDPPEGMMESWGPGVALALLVGVSTVAVWIRRAAVQSRLHGDVSGSLPDAAPGDSDSSSPGGGADKAVGGRVDVAVGALGVDAKVDAEVSLAGNLGYVLVRVFSVVSVLLLVHSRPGDEGYLFVAAPAFMTSLSGIFITSHPAFLSFLRDPYSKDKLRLEMNIERLQDHDVVSLAEMPNWRRFCSRSFLLPLLGLAATLVPTWQFLQAELRYSVTLGIALCACTHGVHRTWYSRRWRNPNDCLVGSVVIHLVFWLVLLGVVSWVAAAAGESLSLRLWVSGALLAAGFVLSLVWFGVVYRKEHRAWRTVDDCRRYRQFEHGGRSTSCMGQGRGLSMAEVTAETAPAWRRKKAERWPRVSLEEAQGGGWEVCPEPTEKGRG